MSAEHVLPVHELSPVSLADVLEAAALPKRTDRKYLVAVVDAAHLVRELAGSHQVLEIAGRRSTSYRSTYIDTGELRLCRDHIQGRRLRWKARSRLYVEDGLCRFEVKTKSSRGETVKLAVDLDEAAYGQFGDTERAFVAEALGHDVSALDELRPVVEVSYSRTTLVDLNGGTRLTFDHGVIGRPAGPTTSDVRSGVMAVDGDHVIVESKGGPRATPADRLLAKMSYRPLSLSKYTTTAALLGEGVPDNSVRRLVGRGVSYHVAPTVRRRAR